MTTPQSIATAKPHILDRAEKRAALHWIRASEIGAVVKASAAPTFAACAALAAAGLVERDPARGDEYLAGARYRVTAAGLEALEALRARGRRRPWINEADPTTEADEELAGQYRDMMRDLDAALDSFDEAVGELRDLADEHARDDARARVVALKAEAEHAIRKLYQEIDSWSV